MHGDFNLENFGRSSLEGGDVLPIGNRTVLIGMSERTQGSMIEQIAEALFARGSAERVIACVMTRDRAHMHLDTVFTMLDRDKVTIFPKVVSQIRAVSLRPGRKPGDFHVTVEKDLLTAVADALEVPKLHVVETGGDQYQMEREQWDDANNTVALKPGLVVSYERNTHTIARMRIRRGGGHHDPRVRARQGSGWGALHDLSHPARRDLIANMNCRYFKMVSPFKISCRPYGKMAAAVSNCPCISGPVSSDGWPRQPNTFLIIV